MRLELAITLIAIAHTLEQQRHQGACGCRGILVVIKRTGEPDPEVPAVCPHCGTPVRRGVVLVEDGGEQSLSREDLLDVIAADLEQLKRENDLDGSSVFADAYEMVASAALQEAAERAVRLAQEACEAGIQWRAS